MGAVGREGRPIGSIGRSEDSARGGERKRGREQSSRAHLSSVMDEPRPRSDTASGDSESREDRHRSLRVRVLCEEAGG